MTMFDVLALMERGGKDAGKPSGRRPIVVANPPGDAAFRALIDRFLAGGDGQPQELEGILRARYENAVVRPRELAAESLEVWYAYRDGHWIGSDDDAPNR